MSKNVKSRKVKEGPPKRRTYGVICADPPWSFGDKLRMSDVKRGADAHYTTMSVADIATLPVNEWAAKDAVLALWFPGSFFEEICAVARSWGFKPKQIVTWLKGENTSDAGLRLAFGMGRQFRSCTEFVLIATKGSPQPDAKNQRNFILHKAMPHSQKPEKLQDMLDVMYPKATKLEMFARRARKGWKCVGLESPDTAADLTTWKPPRLK